MNACAWQISQFRESCITLLDSLHPQAHKKKFEKFVSKIAQSWLAFWGSCNHDNYDANQSHLMFSFTEKFHKRPYVVTKRSPFIMFCICEITTKAGNGFLTSQHQLIPIRVNKLTHVFYLSFGTDQCCAFNHFANLRVSFNRNTNGYRTKYEMNQELSTHILWR